MSVDGLSDVCMLNRGTIASNAPKNNNKIDALEGQELLLEEEIARRKHPYACTRVCERDGSGRDDGAMMAMILMDEIPSTHMRGQIATVEPPVDLCNPIYTHIHIRTHP